MINRLRHLLPHRLTAPLAVVTLVGVLGLAARNVATPSLDKGSRTVAPLVSASPAPRAIELAPFGRKGAHSAVWLPPLDAGTRTVLTSFPPQEYETPPSTPPPQLKLREATHLALLPAERSDCAKNPPAIPGNCAPSGASVRAEDSPAADSLLVFREANGQVTSISLSEPVPTAPMPPETGRAPVRSAEPPTGPTAPVVRVDQPAHARPAEARSPEASRQPPGLLPVGARQDRSWNLELIAREADGHSCRGFDLAGRNAYLSARAEFIMALRLVAQGLDAEHQTTEHSRALAAGLTALKETDDFIPRGSQLEADLDLETIVRAHRTPVLKNTELAKVTPLVAVQSYYTYAQEQLAQAAGREVAGSMALYGLGKLHQVAARKELPGLQAAEPRAMVFYQAALLVSPRNYMASNDLGVLLARAGRYEDARIALEHSLSINPSGSGWHNLATVYQQLGRPDMADQASRKSLAVGRKEPGHRVDGRNSPPDVRWVDAQVFAQAGDAPGIPDQTRAAAKLAQTDAPAGPTSAVSSSPIARPTAVAPASPSPAAAWKSRLAENPIWNWFSK